MLKKSACILLLTVMYFIAAAQDSTTNKSIAIAQLKALKTGALVVRLKTNDKSIDAYRNSGDFELAEKITTERQVQNQKIHDAFKDNFDFCKVYFIYAKNSNELVNGAQNIFLDDALVIDTSIHLKEKYFLIAEYGSTTTNERTDEYHYSGVLKTEPSNSTGGSSVIFISDTTFTQLKEPFPFYSAVYLDSYTKSVDQLNKALHRVYLHFLYKEDQKELKKKLKSSPNNLKF